MGLVQGEFIAVDVSFPPTCDLVRGVRAAPVSPSGKKLMIIYREAIMIAHPALDNPEAPPIPPAPEK
jgi:hypothetical protein